MADLSRDIRLAVDSGEVAVGAESVISSIKKNSAKLVIVASVGKRELQDDIQHLAKLSEIRVTLFKGNPMDLGTVCGKPFSVSTISIVNPGNSKILSEDYSKAEGEPAETKAEGKNEVQEEGAKEQASG